MNILKYICIVFLFYQFSFGQQVSLFKQFNGKYDFTFVGNTLNKEENSFGLCEINTSSSATLNLNPTDEIVGAYLYWAGSGEGDYDVKLNNQNIGAERRFKSNVYYTYEDPDTGEQFQYIVPYFSAFTDVTSTIKQTKNGNYTVSDLDLTETIDNFYCFSGTNFAGWAILIIFKNENSPLYQLNVYDGLEMVPDEITINLDNLNVIDNKNARIGFIAWEGDKELAVNETLRINGNIISNPPLNPETNAFNGTNSITGVSTLYNMDLDIYNIENNIKIGDISAEIKLTSGQDVIFINTIVTRLNSQLPDATVTIKPFTPTCDSRKVDLNYSLNNFNSTEILPSGTSVTVMVNDDVFEVLYIAKDIPINGHEDFSTSLQIPESYGDDFEITVRADVNNLVNEINEANNDSTIQIKFYSKISYNKIKDLTACNIGLSKAYFNLNEQVNAMNLSPELSVSFYNSLIEAEQNQNPIQSLNNYLLTEKNKTINYRISNENCYVTDSFNLKIINCPPIIYNVITPNNDGKNDVLSFTGIKDIFTRLEIEIYSRWGQLVWKGNHANPYWDGTANSGLIQTEGNLPEGTYFYVIHLNDDEVPEPLVGYIFLTR